MGKLKEKLEAIADKIEDTLVDFTTLDVVTLSGDIDVNLLISQKGEGKKRMLKPLDIYSNALVKAHIVAFSHHDFDVDTVQFVGNVDENDFKYKLHVDSVTAAQNMRKAMLDFIREVIE